MDLEPFLQNMVQLGASDLYVTAGSSIALKIEGQLKSLSDKQLTADDTKKMAYAIMDESQIKAFELTHEMNLALSKPNLGRFRVNIYQQRNSVGMVVRSIKLKIPTLDELGIPAILKTVVMQKHGLLLFVGATGSGKSTSIAALLDHRNTNTTGHIITIEDPIEFIYQHKKCIVSQREVGVDTESYDAALKNTLRQAPDVILIGEIRSAETMAHAITFAETGHLVLSTLHANNTNQAMERIISFFPEESKQRFLLDLSLNLAAIVSERLIPTGDGKRVAAFEVLLATPLACDLIKRGEVAALKDVIQKSEHLGMQTFDDSLYQLYKEGRITLENAVEYADSQQNLRLRVKLESGNTDNTSQLSIDNYEPSSDSDNNPTN